MVTVIIWWGGGGGSGGEKMETGMIRKECFYSTFFGTDGIFFTMCMYYSRKYLQRAICDHTRKECINFVYIDVYIG